ncbi:MAG: ABC transporter ATP-binding protein [Candidatus Rokubacteria bacterium]|nr:ABC transporter ATP-binding protein [Candidatus Rokubacteria bacterium]
MSAAEPILEVANLVVELAGDDGMLRAVDGVSLSIGRGEVVGLVGESGAGKTLTAEAMLGLVRCPPGRVTGTVRFHGHDLLELGERELARIRGKEIAMIFQNPGASLNPVFRIGDQVVESMALHLPGARRDLRQRAADILQRVGIPAARTRMRDYPHQFSGGMAQRVMIGMGVSCTPSLLIADEPTTALDVTIQAQVLALIRSLAREMGMAVLLVSHDLGIVSQMCHRVIVMYAGRVVEQASIGTIFRAPAHPYTRALMACLPGLDGVARLGTIPGVMPGLTAVPSGCRFHPRCAVAEPRCAVEEPVLRDVGDAHRAACHLARRAGEGPRVQAAAMSARNGEPG